MLIYYGTENPCNKHRAQLAVLEKVNVREIPCKVKAIKLIMEIPSGRIKNNFRKIEGALYYFQRPKGLLIKLMKIDFPQ